MNHAIMELKLNNLISILNYGLRKPGEKTPDGKVI